MSEQPSYSLGPWRDRNDGGMVIVLELDLSDDTALLYYGPNAGKVRIGLDVLRRLYEPMRLIEPALATAADNIKRGEHLEQTSGSTSKE